MAYSVKPSRSYRFDKHLKEQDGLCALCGRPFVVGLHVKNTHHWVSRKNGGSEHWSNTCAVHDVCNVLVGERDTTPELQAECRKIPEADLVGAPGVCRRCGCEFTGRGENAWYCLPCREARCEEQSDVNHESWLGIPGNREDDREKSRLRKVERRKDPVKLARIKTSRRQADERRGALRVWCGLPATGPAVKGLTVEQIQQFWRDCPEHAGYMPTYLRVAAREAGLR